MSRYNHKQPDRFTPISAWGYVGYSILFSFPLIGQILLIVFSISKKNINRRNYARSFFCWLLIALVLFCSTTFLLNNRYVTTGGLVDNVQRTTRDITKMLQNIISQTNASELKTFVEPKSSEGGQVTTSEDSKAESSQDSNGWINVKIRGKKGKIRKSFKNAMDEYEAFFDEYIEVIKTQDINRLSTFMVKYSETLAALEQMEDSDLTNTELEYYTIIHSRIMKKLSSIE